MKDEVKRKMQWTPVLTPPKAGGCYLVGGYREDGMFDFALAPLFHLTTGPSWEPRQPLPFPIEFWCDLPLHPNHPDAASDVALGGEAVGVLRRPSPAGKGVIGQGWKLDGTHIAPNENALRLPPGEYPLFLHPTAAEPGLGEALLALAERWETGNENDETFPRDPGECADELRAALGGSNG